MKRNSVIIALLLLAFMAVAFSNSSAGGKSGILGEWLHRVAPYYPIPNVMTFLSVSCYTDGDGDHEIVAETYNKNRNGSHDRQRTFYADNHSTYGRSQIVVARFSSSRLHEGFGEGFSISYVSSTDQLVLQATGPNLNNGRAPEQLSFTYERCRGGSPCPQEEREPAQQQNIAGNNGRHSGRTSAGPTVVIFTNTTRFQLNIYHSINGGDCRYMEHDGTIGPNRQTSFSVAEGELAEYLFTTCPGPCGTDCSHDYSGNYKEFRSSIKGGSGQALYQNIY